MQGVSSGKKIRFTTTIIFPVPLRKASTKFPKTRNQDNTVLFVSKPLPLAPLPPQSPVIGHTQVCRNTTSLAHFTDHGQNSAVKGNAMICFFARNYVSGSVLPSASWLNQLANWGEPILTPVSHCHNSQQPSIHPSTVLSAHLLQHPLRCAALRAALYFRRWCGARWICGRLQV